MLSPAWRANLVSVKVKCKADGGGRLSQILRGIPNVHKSGISSHSNIILAVSDVISEHKKYWGSPVCIDMSQYYNNRIEKS